MAGDEIGVQMRLNDVLDLQPVLASLVEVNRHIPLRVNHSGHAFRTDHVRGVRKTAQIELLEVHVDASLLSPSRKESSLR